MNGTNDTMETALRLLAAPVTVIGIRNGAELGGLTAAWVTRVSTAPPLLLVAVGHERHTWQMLAAASELSVSVLHAEQVAVARLFGLHSRRDTDKWARTEHELIGDGVPTVTGCAARYLGRIRDRFTTGDHDCVVCEITLAETVRGAPVLPLRGADYGPAGSGD